MLCYHQSATAPVKTASQIRPHHNQPPQPPTHIIVFVLLRTVIFSAMRRNIKTIALLYASQSHRSSMTARVLCKIHKFVCTGGVLFCDDADVFFYATQHLQPSSSFAKNERILTHISSESQCTNTAHQTVVLQVPSHKKCTRMHSIRSTALRSLEFTNPSNTIN